MDSGTCDRHGMPCPTKVREAGPLPHGPGSERVPLIEGLLESRYLVPN